MLRPRSRPAALTAAVLLAAGLAAGCGGGSNTVGPAGTGAFLALATDVAEGAVWELNRPIRIEFNHPLDPSSISFGSVRIEGTSGAAAGRPVTGSFEIEAGSGGRILVFQPTCPTGENYDDGGLLPGGHRYRLSLPTASHFGATVLRDLAGRPLARGLERTFRTPLGTEPLFLDPRPGPAEVVAIDWPRGLNLYTDPEPFLTIHFDQPIDGRASNLGPDRIRVRYSEQPASIGGDPVFLHDLPGRAVLAENCTGEGAAVRFEFSGLLPEDRWLQVVLGNDFRDIAGQTRATEWRSEPHPTPTLSEVYGAALLGWNEDQETIDEFREDFLDGSGLDPAAALRVPPAVVRDGALEAGFAFTSGISSSADLELLEDLELRTEGQFFFYDANNRLFLAQDGVLRVDDLHIGPGATLRGEGQNPLIIYVQGSALIEGVIDVSGHDSYWPTSLNSPQYPEGPIVGACGGGQGGMASRITTALTPRGDPGQTAFGLSDGGG
ncbi:MAG: hypothetical protein D6702_03115, partial [Planctomycetota bacterium]